MIAAPTPRTGADRNLHRLLDDRAGLALTEFAFCLPILMVLMASGLELSNYVLATKRVGDLAAMVADNASRMGMRSAGLSVHQISEAEINDVFTGAELQAGLPDFTENGRIILSSLQRNADDGQWIAWQRCFGNNGLGSSYGEQGDGASGTAFEGMGPPDNRVQAARGTAVMFVEVTYNYDPVFPVMSLPARTLREFAVFNVRESRDLNMPRNAENVDIQICEG